MNIRSPTSGGDARLEAAGGACGEAAGDICAATSFVGIRSAAAQTPVAPLTPAQVQDAIAHGIKAKNVDLIPVSIDSKWAMGGGPRIGWASGPWLRIARAANNAKRKYKTFTPAEVSEEDAAPELHIYILSREVHGAENKLNRTDVEAIVITPKKGNDDEKRAAALQPTRITELPTQYQNLFGAETEATGMMAVFPLDAYTDDKELRVIFATRVEIAGVVGCSDCKAKLNLKGPLR